MKKIFASILMLAMGAKAAPARRNAPPSRKNRLKRSPLRKRGKRPKHRRKKSRRKRRLPKQKKKWRSRNPEFPEKAKGGARLCLSFLDLFGNRVPDCVRIYRQDGTISRRDPDGYQREAAQHDGKGSRQTVRQWFLNRSFVSF